MEKFGGTRLIAGYLAVTAFLIVAIGTSISIGSDRHAEPAIGGFYSSTSDCLGDKFELQQSGQFIDLSGPSTGKLRLQSGRLHGTANCAGGGTAPVSLELTGKGETASFAGTVGSDDVTAKFVEPLPEPGASAKKPVKRTGEETFGRLMLAIAAVLLAARLVGTLIARLSQPRVMGEVLAGILLGPTLLGAVWPEAQAYLFPPDIVPLLSGAAQIGLAFYLFLVGMELDPRVLRERIGQAAFISNTSVAFPMALGFLVAIPDLQAAVAGRSLPPVRPLHGRCDVGHGFPGARPHPDRAAHAETTCRRALDGGSRDRRRHGLVSPRAMAADRYGHLARPATCWRSRHAPVIPLLAMSSCSSTTAAMMISATTDARQPGTGR